jgi:hypothetical protein
MEPSVFVSSIARQTGRAGSVPHPRWLLVYTLIGLRQEAAGKRHVYVF